MVSLDRSITKRYEKVKHNGLLKMAMAVNLNQPALFFKTTIPRRFFPIDVLCGSTDSGISGISDVEAEEPEVDLEILLGTWKCVAPCRGKNGIFHVRK